MADQTDARHPARPDDTTTATDDRPERTSESEQRVPVSEAIKYRKRAQEAESQLESLREKVESLETNLRQANVSLDKAERRRSIDQALVEADAIDLETARLLTELAIEQMDEPDIAVAIRDLREHKPFLFRARTRATSAVMGARIPQVGADLETAADDAARSGDRRALLRYLRLRRQSNDT